MVLKFSSAEDIVKTKIERNNLMTKLLGLQNEIMKREMTARYRLMKINEQRIKNIEKINSIENKQIIEYTKIRECEIASLTNLVNEQANISDLIFEIESIKKEYDSLLTQINDLNGKIPNNAVITNYSLV